MRIVLITLDSPLSDAAVAAFLARRGAEVVLVGRSAPLRPGHGPLDEFLRHWRRSGWRLLPYLIVNYALPQALAALTGGAVARAARRAGIPAEVVADANGPAFAARLDALRPDLIVTLHCDQILAPATLARARLGGVNLHPSLLPRHRGPVPAIWALAEPEPAWGVTAHVLAPRIDAGAVLAQRAVALPTGITASGAARALHLAGVPLLDTAIGRVAAGDIPAPPDRLLPYAPFPPPGLLRGLAARGRRLVGWRDLVPSRLTRRRGGG